jgi:isopenicillin-N epimerase
MQLKAGLARMPNVRVITPMAEELSSGLVCFDVIGLTPAAVVDRLHERKIIATLTPYATPHARLAAGLLNSDEQVDAVLSEVRALQT